MTHQSNEARSVLRVLFRALAVGVAVLIAAVSLAGGGLGVAMNALLAALAMTACGAGLGFLFGIPKVLQGSAVDAPKPGDEEQNGDPAAAPARGAGTQYEVNTNLEQISDWLTKIIVGIGLIELRRANEFFDRLSALVVTGLTGVTGAQALAGSMLVYFGIGGFLTGYLATRLYLSGAFRRADAQLGGFALDAEQASRQQEELISELESALTGGPAGEHAPKSGGQRAASRSVLWVDDQPTNNAALIDRMKKAGIGVTTCQSTADALGYLEGSSFTTVITDMGRKEGMRYRREAGFDLITAAREKGYDVDFVIYTSPEEAARWSSQAQKAGAKMITGSPVELLRGVGLL